MTKKPYGSRKGCGCRKGCGIISLVMIGLCAVSIWILYSSHEWREKQKIIYGPATATAAASAIVTLSESSIFKCADAAVRTTASFEERNAFVQNINGIWVVNESGTITFKNDIPYYKTVTVNFDSADPHYPCQAYIKVDQATFDRLVIGQKLTVSGQIEKASWMPMLETYGVSIGLTLMEFTTQFK